MKKLFSFLRKPKAKPNSGPRNRVLTAAEIAAQEEQKRKLAEQQAKAASRKKAQRTAKAAKPRNRILTEGESATTGARPTRTRWFKRRKQRSPQERAARRTQNSIGPIVRDILKRRIPDPRRCDPPHPLPHLRERPVHRVHRHGLPV